MTKEELQNVREALGMAYETLDAGSANTLNAVTNALALIDNALAQTEQEPVAWRTFDGEGGYDYRSYDDNENYRDDWERRNPNHKGWVEPLYAATVAQPVNQMLVEALKELHSVVIDQNRAGTDWGERLGRLMDALGNSNAALAAVGEK